MKTLKQFAKNEKRQEKRFLVEDIRHTLYGSLDEVLMKFKDLKKKYNKKYKNLNVETGVEDYGYDGPYITAALYGSRLETKEEFGKRIELEYQRYQRIEESDQATFERLKKQFE